MYKLDTQGSQTLLTNLKSTFKNKAILIDFWATWCSPCLRDMPYSKKLHEEAEDLPVEFVYLCTSESSSFDKWRTKIAELGLSGTHIFVDRGIENELMSLFSVGGFPSYVLIDKNGKYKVGAIRRMYDLDSDKLAELIK